MKKYPTCFDVIEHMSKQVGYFFKFCCLLPMSCLNKKHLKSFSHSKFGSLNIFTVKFCQKFWNKEEGKFFLEFISVTSITDVSSGEVWLAPKLLTYLFTDHLFSPPSNTMCLFENLHFKKPNLISLEQKIQKHITKNHVEHDEPCGA